MKNTIALFVILFLFYGHLSAQSFTSGQMDVERDNNATAPVLTLKNKFSSIFTSSNLSVFNDLNYRLDFGVRSSGYGDGANHSYIQSWHNKPIDFYTGARKRVSIDSMGRVDFIGGDMLEDTIIRVTTALNAQKDVIGISSVIFPDGESSNWGAGGSFKGGWRGILAKSNVGIGVEATSVSGDAIFAVSNSGKGVFGVSLLSYGVQGTSVDTFGIYGTSSESYGVVGRSSVANIAGVYGYSDDVSGFGVHGVSKITNGVRGECDSGVGVIGISDSGEGVIGTSISGHGMDARSTSEHGIIASTQSVTKYDFKANGPGMDYGAGSSRRWKSNIQNIANPIELISQLRGVRYDWDEEHGGGRHDIGFIAEEVGQILPEIVTYEENGVDAIAMDYTKVPALLVEAINAMKKEYDDRLVELELQIEELQKSTQTGIQASDNE